MHHNDQIRLNGRCNCKCHHGSSICTCQLSDKWRAILSRPKASKKQRKLNLESRVMPFQRNARRTTRRPIAVTKEHGFHAPNQEAY